MKRGRTPSERTEIAQKNIACIRHLLESIRLAHELELSSEFYLYQVEKCFEGEAARLREEKEAAHGTRNTR